MGIKDFFKSIFNSEQYEKDKQAKWNEEWKQKAEVFYPKAKPIVEKLIDEQGYEYFQQKTITIEGQSFRVSEFSWLANQIHRIFSEKFQIDTFGELLFEENHEYSSGNRSYILKDLCDYSYSFGFCDSKFYLKNKSPYLKFIVEYHKVNPEIKISHDLLFAVKVFLENLAELFVYDKYGEHYYDKPGKLTEDERREKAWSDERLLSLFNEVIDPNNPDSAALFAKNISDISIEASNSILKYMYCEYDDRYQLFFGDLNSKNLLKASEIERRLDSKEE